MDVERIIVDRERLTIDRERIGRECEEGKADKELWERVDLEKFSLMMKTISSPLKK